VTTVCWSVNTIRSLLIVGTEIPIFCVMVPCRLVCRFHIFQGYFYLHLQGSPEVPMCPTAQHHIVTMCPTAQHHMVPMCPTAHTISQKTNIDKSALSVLLLFTRWISWLLSSGAVRTLIPEHSTFLPVSFSSLYEFLMWRHNCDGISSLRGLAAVSYRNTTRWRIALVALRPAKLTRGLM
jgi:hypothetical protein